MKRLKYIGPHLDGVHVFDPQADIYAGPIGTVKRGELLPADCPAHVRDELLARADWEEVTASATKKDDA